MPDHDEHDVPKILYLPIGDLVDSDTILRMESDMKHDYYVSDDWSQNFYVLQAIRGFISVGYSSRAKADLILPELQFSYCLLDFHNLHVGSKIRKSLHALANWRLRINHDFESVLEAINTHHEKSWLNPTYRELVTQLNANGPLSIRDPLCKNNIFFHMCSVELYDDTDSLIAGELGYVVGTTYTALTGFCDKRKGKSVGKIQILALAKLLQSCGFSFFNLGQPPTDGHMQYKVELGGQVVERRAFLDRWKSQLHLIPSNISRFLDADISIQSLEIAK